MKIRIGIWGCTLALLLGCGGCVEQTLTVVSDPPGALVYLNDQEVGRTPVTRDFTWYGTYDVTLRHDGYETLKTQAPVIAPLYGWPPFDLFAEILPFHFADHRTLSFALQPQAPTSQPDLLQRAYEMKSELRSGVRPATGSATRPTTREARQP